MRKSLAAVVLAAGLFVAGSATGAVAHNLIGSSDIRDHSIRNVDLRKEYVQWQQFQPRISELEDRVEELEEDAEHPGQGH